MSLSTIEFVARDAPPALVLAGQDDVAVALRPIGIGEAIAAIAPAGSGSGRADGDREAGQTVVAVAGIPVGHKVARRDLADGAPVHKYGQVIGWARGAISAGQHVHVHNLAFRDRDAGHAYASEVPERPIACTDSFLGYRRAGGRAGTRNLIAVIASVNCSATVSHGIVAGFGTEVLAEHPGIDGVAAFTHGTGCGMADSGDGFDNLQRVLAGYARHPNVGGVLMVGLGCEMSQLRTTLAHGDLTTGPLLRTLNIQTLGGTARTIAAGRAMIAEMLDTVGRARREPCPASDLVLGLQCGGSDAWSGITANPALGVASDLIVAQGGATLLAETPEIYGAEHLLTRRAVDVPVAEALMARIDWWRDYVARNHGSMDNNPSPGNKAGGLTTILEKSLGAIAKGGSSALTGVYRYAEPVSRPGFGFMDSPGYDPASVTGQIASGCTLIAFTTGRGSAFGSKPAPCLKIASNSAMYRQMVDDMDIDAGTVVSAGESIETVGRRIYGRLLEVASGAATLSEAQGLGDHEFVPWQIGATM